MVNEIFYILFLILSLWKLVFYTSSTFQVEIAALQVLGGLISSGCHIGQCSCKDYNTHCEHTRSASHDTYYSYFRVMRNRKRWCQYPRSLWSLCLENYLKAKNKSFGEKNRLNFVTIINIFLEIIALLKMFSIFSSRQTWPYSVCSC